MGGKRDGMKSLGVVEKTGKVVLESDSEDSNLMEKTGGLYALSERYYMPWRRGQRNGREAEQTWEKIKGICLNKV